MHRHTVLLQSIATLGSLALVVSHPAFQLDSPVELQRPLTDGTRPGSLDENVGYADQNGVSTHDQNVDESVNQTKKKKKQKSDKLIHDIPSIGLGLWNAKDESATYAVETAIQAGYSHLDSAAAYNNEASVGQGLSNITRELNKSRSSYWITSKLWNTDHRPENVRPALEKTLSDLNTTYLDLYLMHWPVAFKPNPPAGRTILDPQTDIVTTWRAMQDLVSKNRTHPEPGTTRFIGVSNFSLRQLDQIREVGSSSDAQQVYAHEFETHPYLAQTRFVEWHQRQGIKVIAYSPLANINPTYKDKHPDLKPIIEDPLFVDIAKNVTSRLHQRRRAHGQDIIHTRDEEKEENKEKEDSSRTNPQTVTPAQVILAWNLARNVTVIPKSVHKAYIRENLESSQISLTSEEIQKINSHGVVARFNNPSKDWGVSLFEDLDDS